MFLVTCDDQDVTKVEKGKRIYHEVESDSEMW